MSQPPCGTIKNKDAIVACDDRIPIVALRIGRGDCAVGQSDDLWQWRKNIEDGKIDLGQYAVEQLVLSLDPFPRKPGAQFVQPEEPAEISPFAALKALKPQDDQG